ncbi:MAG TPA: ABC transporter permease subunit, partial [Devosia sp.]|nr:ABC transporter permease subunit [Devosia sp.]
MQRKSRLVLIAAILGFVFLYAPMVSLVIFSFNKSKLVTVWGGFSTKWYGELFQNAQILNAAGLSLRIAVISASLALVIGTIAAFVLVRFGRFRGRNLLTGMITSPLVMPDVIIGLSLLLMFVAMQNMIGWPNRGMTTIIIAHATFGAAYVAVVVQSRLRDMDLSVEEAAADLGASATRVFFDITLPIISPALISGWLLSFTLS